MRKFILLILGLVLLFPTVSLAKNIDVALALDKLVPAAVYFGSLTVNTEEAYNKIKWEDSREKPTWKRIQDAGIMIEVDKLDKEKQDVVEAKIQKELRALAISRLKTRGEIPADFVDTK